MPIERKLSAIVFTDIVGFTDLSATDEDRAFKLLELQRDVLKPIVLGHGGSWLKELGDGCLIIFNSAYDALKFSENLQNIINNNEQFKVDFL